jgi:hypothetical protein
MPDTQPFASLRITSLWDLPLACSSVIGMRLSSPIPKDLLGYLVGDRIKAKRVERIAILWKKTRERLQEADPPMGSLSLETCGVGGDRFKGGGGDGDADHARPI